MLFYWPKLFVHCFFSTVFPFLFFLCGVVREVNVRVLAKGLELLSANGDRFKTNQLYLQTIQH